MCKRKVVWLGMEKAGADAKAVGRLVVVGKLGAGLVVRPSVHGLVMPAGI